MARRRAAVAATTSTSTRREFTAASAARSRPESGGAYDFVHDACANGQKLKCLTLIDEFTRECLAIDVAGSIRSARVIEVLTRLVSERGAPMFLRSDNGPEFVSHAILRWLSEARIDTALIDPGKPWLVRKTRAGHNVVTAFFIAWLPVFYVLAEARAPVGLVFFLWIGVFSLMVIAQFWAYANDSYTPEEGKRLFAVIALALRAERCSGPGFPAI